MKTAVSNTYRDTVHIEQDGRYYAVVYTQVEREDYFNPARETRTTILLTKKLKHAAAHLRKVAREGI